MSQFRQIADADDIFVIHDEQGLRFVDFYLVGLASLIFLASSTLAEARQHCLTP